MKVVWDGNIAHFQHLFDLIKDHFNIFLWKVSITFSRYVVPDGPVGLCWVGYCRNAKNLWRLCPILIWLTKIWAKCQFNFWLIIWFDECWRDLFLANILWTEFEYLKFQLCTSMPGFVKSSKIVSSTSKEVLTNKTRLVGE